MLKLAVPKIGTCRSEAVQPPTAAFLFHFWPITAPTADLRHHLAGPNLVNAASTATVNNAPAAHCDGVSQLDCSSEKVDLFFPLILILIFTFASSTLHLNLCTQLSISALIHPQTRQHAATSCVPDGQGAAASPQLCAQPPTSQSHATSNTRSHLRICRCYRDSLERPLCQDDSVAL